MTAKTVFIADDDDSLVRALTLGCRALGLLVRTSFNGMEAVYELFTTGKDAPDLIILDVNMPMQDGLGVWEMLADDRILAPIPVIIFTGRSDAETLRRCEEL